MTEKKLAVIYARYSDSKQTFQSIEGQLKVCQKFADENGYTLLPEYIDEAQTGKNDDRKHFKRMLAESKKNLFGTVIVYSFDRFGRNVLQSLLNEKKLLDNGVTVLSATENNDDTPSGRMQRNIHMTFAQYFSEELAQKTARGMSINADKCYSNGGPVPLGYKVENIDPTDEKSKKIYIVDEDEAEIVREIFSEYANGVSAKEICDSLNARQLKTSTGGAFKKNSLTTVLRSRRYLGLYIYDGREIPNPDMKIIDQELFDRVAEKITVNRKAPAKARAKAEYLLTLKLFCGHCREMMTGHSCISRYDVTYNYYKCKNQGGKNGTCDKKMVHKDYIEDLVVNKCREFLTPKEIKRIAKRIVTVSESYDDRVEIIRLEGLIKVAQKSIENHMASLRKADDMVKEMIIKDLSALGVEIKDLERQLAIENSRRKIITEKQVIEALTKLADGDINNEAYRKSLIRLLVNKIYLYDDKITITFDSVDEEIEITDRLLSEIEAKLVDQELWIKQNEGHHLYIEMQQ